MERATPSIPPLSYDLLARKSVMFLEAKEASNASLHQRDTIDPSRSGLPYMDMRPPTDVELHSLPHILLTSDAMCDPSSLDDEFTLDEIANDAPLDPSLLDLDPRIC